jgi:tetrahydromethanopterin S-methyltransferase subunit F
MAPLLVDASGRCLEQGDVELARQFRRSKYYPKMIWRQDRKNPNTQKAHRRFDDSTHNSQIIERDLKLAFHTCVQGVCASLPAALGCPAYRLVRQIKSGINL